MCMTFMNVSKKMIDKMCTMLPVIKRLPIESALFMNQTSKRLEFSNKEINKKKERKCPRDWQPKAKLEILNEFLSGRKSLVILS